MGIKILGATFGDQLAQRDVTQSIRDKATDGTLDVTANEELIPAFDVSTETKLENSDLAEITKKAEEQCQGGADSACMTSTKAALMREKHAEKARIDTSSANVIAGRALTVTYQDETNKVRRTVVPDGQKLKLANISGVGKPGEPDPSAWDKTVVRVQKSFGDAFSITVWTLTFVFSVAASYRIFKIYGNLPIAIGVAFIALILPIAGASPGVGIIFVMVAFGLIEMGRLSKASTMAAVSAAATPAGGVPGGLDLPGGLGDAPGGLDLPGGLKLPGGLDLPGGLKLPGGLDLPGGLKLPGGLEGGLGGLAGRAASESPMLGRMSAAREGLSELKGLKGVGSGAFKGLSGLLRRK